MIEFKDNTKAKINELYKPPDKIQADRHQVYRLYRDGQNDQSPMIPKWDKWEKQYEAFRPNRSDDDWQSNITPPMTTTIVERSLAEIVDQTIQPTVTARGTEDQARAKIVNYIKDYTWEIGDGDLQLYAGLKQALILGKTIWQEDYWQDKRQVRVLKKFDMEKGEEEYTEKEVFDFDDVYGETFDIRDFFKDPAARTINRGRYKANWAFRRYIMNLDTFQENFIGSIYDQFGVAKLVKAGGDTNYWQYYKPPENIDKENAVEVLFFWGRRPDKHIIVANDVVIRDGPNFYNHKQLPFAEGSDIPSLNQFWSRGEPALVESLQDEMTTLRRMRIDRQHMDIWKMFLVSNRETLDDDEAIVAPSRFMFVDDPTKSIVPLEYRDINPSAYMEEDRLRQDAREVTGIESPRSSGTATEAAIFKESTMKALRLKIWLASRELLTNIIRLRVPNISQFYTTPKVSSILGEIKFSQTGVAPMAASAAENGYRTIRTNNVELGLTREGKLLENEKKGQYFFVVTPDMVTPFYGQFDYKLSGEPTFPVSKPLLQQKVMEFMGSPVIQAAIQTGHYDIGRMADALSEVNDFDPEKFKAPQTAVGAEGPRISEETLYEMANRENEAMLSGKALPGTAFAPRSHTDIHLAFMSSTRFRQKINDTIVANFVKHIKEEEAAQNIRGQAAAQPPQIPGLEGRQSPPGPTTEAAGIGQGEAAATQPARMMGPEMTPPGQGAF